VGSVVGGLFLSNVTACVPGRAGPPGPAAVRIVGDQVAAAGHSVRAEPGDEVVDLSGYVLLPGLAEPHAHLEKAFTAGRSASGTGDLPAAIAAWIGLRGRLTEADFAARARRAALGYLASGATAIRTHTDVGEQIGLTAFRALAAVRAELAGTVDIEIVAAANCPVTGLAGRNNLAAARDAADAGADVIGGAPWLDPEPAEAYRLLLDLAAEAGLPADFHVDETTDPDIDTLSSVLDLAEDGFPHPVTASHVVSLGSRPLAEQRRVAERLARTGTSVVTLPQTNLWLQDWGSAAPTIRGLTPVRLLRAAKVPVAAGADNLRDAFNPLGRADPLETASLLAAAAHLPPEQALAAVSADAWAVMGRPTPAPRVGSPAAFVAVAAVDAADAVAGPPPDRIVIRGDRVVARTRTHVEYATLRTAGENNGLDPHRPAGAGQRPPRGGL
jgi:cytosine/creatinine deaminase